MLTFLSISLILLSTPTPSQCNNHHHPLPQVDRLLRPGTGSFGGPNVHELSCLSWRLAVETDNIREWSTVPKKCEDYVGNYMLGHQYRMDSAVVAHEAISYAKGLEVSQDGKDVWVFDIDETSLSNLPYFATQGFGAEPFNSTSAYEWVLQGKLPVLPETLKLYKVALQLGIKVVFITGRARYLTKVTVANLKNVGFHSWHLLILRGRRDSGKTALVYKSERRTKLEKLGYRIVGNIGDQWSDVLGSSKGNRTFKLPDPMYYIS